mmetsp:Transcript_87076/g.186672  ORF Transcript_87076/g.186672 Transcript_87076/m.186672 type:complete len:680 (+) Transcript_87076:76-2115(+)
MPASMTSVTNLEDWEVVELPRPAWDEDFYEKFEPNEMRACEVSVGEKQLLFCLEPRASFNKEETSRCAATLTNNCRTCIHRISKLAPLIGSGGKHVLFCQEVSDPTLDRIRSMREGSGSSKLAADYQMVVIDAEFMAKYPTTVGPFTHVHFTCDQLTPDDLSAKVKELSAYFNGSFENRFQRLVDDPSSLQIIQNEIPNLARPDHWRSVTSWALEFVRKAKGSTWADLAAHEKYEVMVFAMLTGRSHGSVHLDMQQASNLLDFMDNAYNAAALRAMMDDRSNPETYQVSRVAELLRDKCVTSLCTVTLIWGIDGQPHASDLDLHTKVKGQELYYGQKKVGQCKLDFDANASKVEKNPAENISLNEVGQFQFRVNNFNNRDMADVPFQVTVRKPGFNEVYTGVWPRSRAAGNFMTVCTVTVTKEDLEEKPMELSEAEQKKLANKEAEWERLFGEPSSTLASSEDFELCWVKSAGPGAFAPAKRGAQEIFSQIIAGKPTPAKPTLAERCQLKTLPGFITYVTSNACSLKASPRNFVPAYVTRVETKTDVLSKKFSINAYHRKNELPQQPRSDEQSTVRFDDSWGVSSQAIVQAFVQVNGTWFMVLEGARLPKDPSWPLGAGMYPTHLTPEAHHHRSKWTSFHSLVTPSNPETGVPLVGSALVGLPSFQFILNGREISVSSQ